MNELYYVADGGTIWFDVRDEFPDTDPRWYISYFYWTCKYDVQSKASQGKHSRLWTDSFFYLKNNSASVNTWMHVATDRLRAGVLCVRYMPPVSITYAFSTEGICAYISVQTEDVHTSSVCTDDEYIFVSLLALPRRPHIKYLFSGWSQKQYNTVCPEITYGTFNYQMHPTPLSVNNLIFFTSIIFRPAILSLDGLIPPPLSWFELYLFNEIMLLIVAKYICQFCM